MAVTPDEVGNRQDLAEFLELLSAQVRASPDSIPNSSLAAFLSGAHGWVEDMEGFFLNRGQPVPESPTWSLVAAIFAAAAVYE